MIWILLILYSNRHSADEIYVIGVTDLKAINDFIGEKRYFMGDKLSNIDATLFGYLTQLINHSDGKLSNYVKSKWPTNNNQSAVKLLFFFVLQLSAQI